MNIYIINEVLSDITYGMAVIAASDLSECRAIFEDHFRLKIDELAGTGLDEFDEAIVNNSYKVLPTDNSVQAGVISYVDGTI